MNTVSFLRLVQNAALLLSLVLVFDVFALHWRAGQATFSRYRLAAGLIIGAIGIVVMLTPWVLLPGLVFDTRSVLLSMSGLFFGTAPTLIAMIITAALRVYQGGPGVWPGVSTVVVTGSLGLIWRRARRAKLDEIKLPELYLFGLVTHLIMLMLMFTLPLEMALHTLQNISAPVLAIYPLASTLLGGLMVNRLRREKLADARWHAEETLAQERRLLRTVIDNLPIAIYAKDLQGRKTLANRTDLDNIGLPEAEVLGKTDTEMFPPEVAAYFKADDQAVLVSGTPVIDREELLTNRDGKTFWQLTSKLPLYDADGQIVGLVGIGRDITKRKQAEEALRAERDLVSRMMETSPAGITMVNREGQIVFANPQAEQVLGLHRDDIHQRSYNDPEWRITAYDGGPFPEDELPFVQAQRTLRPVSDVRHAIEWPDGRRVLLRINAAPMLDENGAFNGIIVNVEDVTERVQAENALRDSEERFRALFNQSMEGIYLHDLDGHILDVNMMACAQSGYSREEWLGLTMFDGHPREGTTNLPIAEILQVWRQWEPGQRWLIEAEHQHKDGTVYPVEISTGVIRYGDANVILAIVKNITERKQAEEERGAMLTALQESEGRIRAKLAAILEPEGDIGALELADIIDVPAIQAIMDDFYNLTHIGVAILDLTGAVLVATGWQDICTQFHRAHPDMCKNCLESDTQLSTNVAPGTFKRYHCKNNMWDIATPIIVGGKHLGNLFLGQFLYANEAPDYAIFRAQARQYGLDEAAYLAALDRVPRWTQETVDRVMKFYIRLANLISSLSYSNLKLVRTLDERTQAEEALRESEQKYRALFEQMTEGFALHEIITDADGAPCDYRFLEINPAYEQLTGLTREQCQGQTLLQVLPNIDRHWIVDYGKVALTGEPAYLEDYVPELERYYEVWAYSPQPRQFATLVKNVTERRQQEIERAVLLDAEHEQRLRAETLSDVTLALASALDSSDVLMEILHQAQRLVPATASNITLVENDAFHIVGWRGYAEEATAGSTGNGQELAAMTQPLSDFPINAALVATGQPYIVADTYTDPDWQPLPGMAWIRAHISLPIRLGERVLGVLRLDSNQVGAFTIQDVERLQPLARAAAIALENAQLYTQVQQELEERKRSQAALEASERKFREMLENVHLFAVMLDLDGAVTFCNDFGLNLLTVERSEVLGQNWFETFIPPETRAEMHRTFVQHFGTGDFPAHYENEILTAGGTGRALIAWNNIVIRDPDGGIISIAAVGEDITARRQAEGALQASEAWLRSFVDSMDDVIFSLDAEQRHTAIYGEWVERLGMTEEHFLGRTARNIFGPEAARVHETANVQALTTGVSVTYEWEVNGHHFQTTLSPLRAPKGEIVGLVGVGRDITALKNYHTQLQTALDEKTLMLSEIHHRIKNNLQVILGLLELQFAAVEDAGTQQMLRESQNRIKAIALIHERLYQTPGESQINARLYFQSLVRYLTQTYDAMVREIVVEQSIADLELDIDLAIPCALIINELISNALKYAFPPGWQPLDGTLPSLRVVLQQTDNLARLEVVDNGVGLPEDIDLETSPRLGLRLIKMLTRQIDGELHIEQNEGTCIAVTFAWDEEK